MPTPSTASWHAPSNYEVIALPEAPDVGALYRKAIGRTATASLTRPKARPLPAVALRVGGVRVERERLTDYQHLLGHRADDVAPPGLIHVLTFPLSLAIMVRPDFPLPAVGMVHLSSHISQIRDLYVDEELEITAWAEQAREHRRGISVDLVAVVRDERGEPVWRGVATYLAKGAAPGRVLGMQPAATSRQPTSPLPAQPTAQWSVSAADIHTYAQVSQDRNPIHTSKLAAKVFGFPRVIAHGMYTAARAFASSGAHGTLDWQMWFSKPLLIPGKPLFAQVTGLTGSDDDGAERGGAAAFGSAECEQVVWKAGSDSVYLRALITTTSVTS